MSRLKEYAKDFALAKSESCRSGSFFLLHPALLESWQTDIQSTSDWHLHDHASYSPELLLSIFTSQLSIIKEQLSKNLDVCLDCVRVFYDAQAVYVSRYESAFDVAQCQKDLFAWNCIRLHTTLSRCVRYALMKKISNSCDAVSTRRKTGQTSTF